MSVVEVTAVEVAAVEVTDVLAGDVEVAEVTAVDSEEDVVDIVEVTAVDSEDEVSEVIGKSSADSGPPLLFRGYRRGRELGRGASGQVFVCKKKGCPSGFAVKAVSLRRMRLSSNAEREQKKLRREVDILKQLPPHRSIVQLTDAFEEGDWFLLILELVGGGDLFTVLTDREPPRLQEREAAFVLQQLADGLAFLHGEGVIHRDMKLENVLVASERRERPSEGSSSSRQLVLYNVKITDFGMSKAIGHGLSDAKSRVGTRPYSAPEVWSEESYDFSSDVWSLGVLLYVLLAGHFPFSNIPTLQAEVCRIVNNIKGSSKAARSLVGGLLQLEAKQRLSLEAICGHEWLIAEGVAEAVERPAKRHRAESTDMLDVPTVSTAADSGGSSDAAASTATEIAASPQRPRKKEALIMDIEVDDPSPGPIVEVMASPFPQSPQDVHGPFAAETAASKRNHVSAPRIPRIEQAFEKPRAAASPHQGPRADPVLGLSCLASPIRVSDVRKRSKQPNVMQVHLTIAAPYAAGILSTDANDLEKKASSGGCQVWTTPLDGACRIVLMGNFNQCSAVQNYVHKQIADAMRAEGQEPPAEIEVVLLVRAETAGVVIGKQGFKIKQIGKQSGANVKVLQEAVERQRPCVITGSFENVLSAERHVYDVVRVVPVESGWGKEWHGVEGWGGPNQPRSRLFNELRHGQIVSWKGKVGWIQPENPIDHPQARAHHGHIYLHEKDVVGVGFMPGQSVSFHVYADKTGLGAEECILRNV